MDEKLYWLGFSAFSGIGPARMRELLDYFGTAKCAWNSSSEDLKQAGLGNTLVTRFEDFKKIFSLENYYQELQTKQIKFLICTESEYPKLLSTIKNPPLVLYFKGEFDWEDFEKQTPVSVVGTRNITSYGVQVTRLLVQDLVNAGCIIVSGLALGVDSFAHSTALENNGQTIAVLGSGVDNCTPKTNFPLYSKILQSGGAIISEQPPGQEPTKGSFPSRNRIIAGLSLGVIVTEGAEDSGSLITANDGFANNRKVFAIPGPITSAYSKGPNSLLTKGAIPITSAKDVLNAFAIPHKPTPKKIQADTPEEQKIINLLQNGQMHIDELVKHIGTPVSGIGTTLSLMEMKGYIQNLGSGLFALETA